MEQEENKTAEGRTQGVIKPCPFCGEAPKVCPENPDVEGNAWAKVQCLNLECPAQVEVYDGIDVSDDRGSDKYKEAAIARWNTRAL